MFARECLCVIVISRIGEGGKPKYEIIRPYGRKTRLPGCILPPYRNNKSPEALISQDFRASMGKKKNHADCIKYCVVTCVCTNILIQVTIVGSKVSGCAWGVYMLPL